MCNDCTYRNTDLNRPASPRLIALCENIYDNLRSQQAACEAVLQKYPAVSQDSRTNAAQQPATRTPAADQGHGDTYNFFINITFNILGPLRDLLGIRNRSEDDRNIDYGRRRGIEPRDRTRRGSSMTDSRITLRIEELPDSFRHSGSHRGNDGAHSRYSRSEPATTTTRQSRHSSKRSESLTPAALWALEQSSRNKRSSGQTSYAEGRSRRAPTEMETVRSGSTLLSKAKSLFSGGKGQGGRSEAGRSQYSSHHGSRR